MTTFLSRRLVVVAALLLVGGLQGCGRSAQQDSTAVPDLARPVVDFVAREGSWMTTSVTSDGAEVIFDLLGALYRVPIEGGEAQRNADPGDSWEFCPSVSPDGASLAFLSNRDGFTDIWIHEFATGNRRRLTGTSQWKGSAQEHYRMTCSPRWSADGKTLVTAQR